MPNSEYKLRYLPLFYEDLNEKVEYIAFEKLNPTAALKLVDAVEAAILERLPIAESFETYPSLFERNTSFFKTASNIPCCSYVSIMFEYWRSK